MKVSGLREILIRASVAGVGGYVLSAVFAAILAILLPLARADSVLLGAMLSLPLYLLVICVVYAHCRGSFRQSMNWLHTWSGLLLSWVLYLVFITGTASYYRNDITLWMKPEAQATEAPREFVSQALDELRRRAPDAVQWVIGVPNARSQALSIQWADSTASSALNAPLYWSQAEQDFVAGRETEGGDFLFRFHYRLHLPGNLGIWLVGLATMMLCVGLVSGLVIHRRIFKDFFTFRPRKSASRSWLDLHNLAGTLALPFHFMIAYTGLITLLSTYMPWAQNAVYGEESSLLFEESYPVVDTAAPRENEALLEELTGLLEQGERSWDGAQVERLFITHPGDARQVVETWPRFSGRISRYHSRVVFAGDDTGTALGESVQYGPGVSMRGGAVGLHLGHFAGPWLKGMFFLCGLAASLMIASGLVLWERKRRGRGTEGFGHWLVARLNLAVLMGTPIAVATYFLANRLVPPAVVGRDTWEVRLFFLALGASLIHAFLRPQARAWREQVGVAALLFVLLPVVNAVTTQRGLLASLGTGDALFVMFDVAMLLLGAIFGWAWMSCTGEAAPGGTSIATKPAMRTE